MTDETREFIEWDESINGPMPRTRAVPTSADIEAIRQRNERARALVGRLCTREEKWRMSVPVDMERDSDMVLDAALMDTDALLASLDGERRHRADLEAENARLREVLAPSDDPLHNSVIAIMESWLAHVKEQNAQRADLERQLEEARELLRLVEDRMEPTIYMGQVEGSLATEELFKIRAFLVQEAETP